MRRWLIALMACVATPAVAQVVVSPAVTSRSLDLNGAAIVYDARDAELLGIAARDLADDIARLGGQAQAVTVASSARTQVWVGTPGHHAGIDALIKAGALDVGRLKNCWECSLTAVVSKPAAGIERALIIVGSDRRGAAFGVYDLTRALGVSPWVWWADVTPVRKGLNVSVPKPYFSKPSVTYRGFFINDEDWGLFPWAAQTFDPETGNIGPKTYEKVFQLLLRLKANTLWPAMHKVSAPFNANPQNAALAERYGIVMGSSHAEPMLRNNVGEWTEPGERFNYATHPQGVRAYWEARLKTNGRYENMYTLGMRGIHDSGIVGASTTAEKQALLNRILSDQRQLLKDTVGDPKTLPQVFVPYKEVLDIYRAGIDLPEDVTLVWPDDNFGYIRYFPNAAEQKRSGRSGVYYHLSYLGAPLSYLWLSTTPPALVTEEMTRAYDNGADRLWVVNAGDIKPSEVNLTHFFDLAWDVKGVRALSQKQYLTRLAGETFGADKSAVIGDLWDRYYRLNFERRPEHLQYYLPGEKARRSGLSPRQVFERVSAFENLMTDVEALKSDDPGLFQLVEYPLKASALANRRFFALEAYVAEYERNPRLGGLYAGRARAFDAQIKALTARYNSGKWAGIIAEEPADALWTSFRLSPPVLPTATLAQTGELPVYRLADDGVIRLEAEGGVARGWRRIEGLGRGEGSLRALRADAVVSLRPDLPKAGTWCVSTHILPVFPTDGAAAWSLDLKTDGVTTPLTYARGPQDKAWQQGVLHNRLTASVPLTLGGGRQEVQLRSLRPDLILDGIDFTPGTCP
ncbi:MAG: glycosyl hydrolase 115 family protein [Asticcacaulis sp.]|uniref:glycosyl hydrolase 115 family protein n=1 Tax=Asticcacaulis sp. TaxID=1872648 RepID=UPI0025BC1869|nr:glycosyl hydrolase 115 family protein [Asticcacaulis sp.]MCA1934055.1 glycosyl hydrolase 115 family protein [Asticcacaulis sp.]